MALESLPKIAPALFSAEQDLIQIYNKKSDTFGTINASLLGGSTPPSGVSGAIQFSTGSAFGSDSANLFWDNVNKRLGVNTNAPISTMHIAGLSTFVGASGSTLGSTTANAAAQFYQNGFTGVLGIGGYSNGGAELQSYQSGGAALGGQIILQRQSGSVHVGTATGAGKLTVQGSGSTSATTSLLVQNSAGSTVINAKDDGNIRVDLGKIQFNNNNRWVGPRELGTGLQIYAINSGDVVQVTTNTQLNISSVGGITPESSAILQMESTTKGFLPPRMTTAQRNAIASPANSLIVFDTDLQNICYRRDGVWVQVSYTAA